MVKKKARDGATKFLVQGWVDREVYQHLTVEARRTSRSIAGYIRHLATADLESKRRRA